jgi:excisionase family DNA binding protein
MSPTEAPTPAEPLRASEAARRLEMPTKDLLRLIHERQIRYVMVDGIAHVPEDAIDEYRGRAAS